MNVKRGKLSSDSRILPGHEEGGCFELETVDTGKTDTAQLSADEIAALEADGYKKTAWGSAIVDNEKEYGDYLFYKYDYNKAPIYLFPFSPNVMSTGGFTNGYGFANNE